MRGGELTGGGDGSRESSVNMCKNDEQDNSTQRWGRASVLSESRCPTRRHRPTYTQSDKVREGERGRGRREKVPQCAVVRFIIGGVVGIIGRGIPVARCRLGLGGLP